MYIAIFLVISFIHSLYPYNESKLNKLTSTDVWTTCGGESVKWDGLTSLDFLPVDEGTFDPQKMISSAIYCEIKNTGGVYVYTFSNNTEISGLKVPRQLTTTIISQVTLTSNELVSAKNYLFPWETLPDNKEIQIAQTSTGKIISICDGKLSVPNLRQYPKNIELYQYMKLDQFSIKTKEQRLHISAEMMGRGLRLTNDNGWLYFHRNKFCSVTEKVQNDNSKIYDILIYNNTNFTEYVNAVYGVIPKIPAEDVLFFHNKKDSDELLNSDCVFPSTSGQLIINDNCAKYNFVIFLRREGNHSIYHAYNGSPNKIAYEGFIGPVDDFNPSEDVKKLFEKFPFCIGQSEAEILGTSYFIILYISFIQLFIFL